jgi:hypothetical protein
MWIRCRKRASFQPQAWRRWCRNWNW